MPADHFSDRSQAYARFRPRYPGELFSYLASLPERRARAWDCATGSGQAAVALAAFFDEVVATDLSARQIAAAERRPNVRYAVATAEASRLEAASVDLVAVAQALHWLDFDRFYDEVRRVTRPGAVIAAWGYGLHTVDPPIDGILRRFYADVVGPFWPPERRYLDERYETVPFPFARIPAPPFEMRAVWTLDHLLGYLRTWSAVKRYEEARGEDPVAEVERDLARAWGARLRTVRWPLYLKLGRV